MESKPWKWHSMDFWGKVQVILCADNKFIIEKSEDVLQIAENELKKFIKTYDMKTFASNKSNVFL
jgi:hypothetical protein